ncbi:hypothetical protein B0F88_1365 [Methylobacter tundripaludum]|uniref:Uncharacterized protein n=1 Tax=Methylobacter tundripaludum TaxID=173365 RepID=A0A2S6GEA5_9GAMM|nr:hypothetical protein [Methylobacter tundripaludum]PPK63471.1 hypothetical protein B0F88_1365 [Methylobacter tundripaludum]
MTRYYELPTTFSEWRIFARYTMDECVRTFSVTRRTVNNWETGKIEPPRAVFLCLMVFSGRLDFLGKRWRGFRITPDCIEAPNGDFVRSEEINAMKYAMQALEINRLRRCRMNEDENGKTESYQNVTFIDKKTRINKPTTLKRKHEENNTNDGDKHNRPKWINGRERAKTRLGKNS